MANGFHPERQEAQQLRRELGPLVFETMVFKTERTPEGFREAEDYQERYRTWEEAIEGHERARATYAKMAEARR